MQCKQRMIVSFTLVISQYFHIPRIPPNFRFLFHPCFLWSTPSKIGIRQALSQSSVDKSPQSLLSICFRRLNNEQDLNTFYKTHQLHQGFTNPRASSLAKLLTSASAYPFSATCAHILTSMQNPPNPLCLSNPHPIPALYQDAS